MNMPQSTIAFTREYELKPNNNTMPPARRCKVYCEIDLDEIMRWYGGRALGNKSKRTKQLGGWIRIVVKGVDSVA